MGPRKSSQEMIESVMTVERIQALKRVTDDSGSGLQHRLYLTLRNKYELTVLELSGNNS